MSKVGVTGGIGSGKTLICNVFSKLGIPVFNADNEAKIILNTDKDVISTIKELFGNDIYINNSIDRKKLAEIIFNNEEALTKINSLVHPKVRLAFKKWCLQFSNLPYVIQEAAILFESEAYKELDYTITVHASEATRVKRVMQRDGVIEEKIKERIKNQMSDEERLKLADYVINNDEDTMVLPQILDIHQKLIKRNK
jgi:dephospho-CoA kinase